MKEFGLGGSMFLAPLGYIAMPRGMVGPPAWFTLEHPNPLSWWTERLE